MKKELRKNTPHKRSYFLIAAALAATLLCSISAQAQADSQPTRFDFFFNGPARGMRLWQRNRDQWTETYSSGQKGTFRVKKVPYLFRGLKGALVQKVDEPDFFVFIPNLDSAKMEVWTYKAKGPWRFLAKMKNIQPGRID